MGVFERYLSIWVALAMLAGLVGGTLFPAIFSTLGSWEYASINFVIAVLIWLMIYPMMMQIDFTAGKKHSSSSKRFDCHADRQLAD